MSEASILTAIGDFFNLKNPWLILISLLIILIVPFLLLKKRKKEEERST